MRVALYCRVSTDDQNPDLQRRELHEFARRRGDKIAAVYLDKISGAKASRPELDRMLSELSSFEAVFVWKFSRLGRSAHHLLQLLENFRLRGVRLISMTEGIDLDSPAGKLVFTILAAVAEMEREYIRENVKAGIAAKRATDPRWGRRPREVPAEAIRRAVEMHRGREGYSWREIAALLKIPLSTLFLAVQNTRPQKHLKKPRIS